MKHCTNCGKELNSDEKQIGNCLTCGEPIEPAVALSVRKNPAKEPAPREQGSSSPSSDQPAHDVDSDLTDRVDTQLLIPPAAQRNRSRQDSEFLQLQNEHFAQQKRVRDLEQEHLNQQEQLRDLQQERLSQQKQLQELQEARAQQQQELLRLHAILQEVRKQRQASRTPLIISMLILFLLLVAADGGMYYLMQVNQSKTPGTISTAIARNQAQLLANATATTTAQAPYPKYIAGYGTLLLSDALTIQNNATWDTNGNCFFSAGAYHITTQQGVTPCFAHIAPPTNFVFQVQVSMDEGGENCAGMFFRTSAATKHFPYFAICNDGYYKLQQDGYGGFFTTNEIRSSAVIPGFDAMNLLAVVVHGPTIDAYINRVKVASATTSNLSGGAVGLLADIYQKGNTDATFNNACIWTMN